MIFNALCDSFDIQVSVEWLLSDFAYSFNILKRSNAVALPLISQIEKNNFTLKIFFFSRGLEQKKGSITGVYLNVCSLLSTCLCYAYIKCMFYVLKYVGCESISYYYLRFNFNFTLFEISKYLVKNQNILIFLEL